MITCRNAGSSAASPITSSFVGGGLFIAPTSDVLIPTGHWRPPAVAALPIPCRWSRQPVSVGVAPGATETSWRQRWCGLRALVGDPGAAILIERQVAASRPRHRLERHTLESLAWADGEEVGPGAALVRGKHDADDGRWPWHEIEGDDPRIIGTHRNVFAAIGDR